MKLALVDDDRTQLALLQSLIDEALREKGIDDRQIEAFSGSTAFFASWQPGSYDIIILDIYMDELSGVEIARRIRLQDENVALAFCTSSNEFAAQSYEVNARYYLQKPITREKLGVMLQRLDLERIAANRSIRLPDGYRLLLRRVISTNYVNHVVTFTLQGLEPHSLYISQAEVEKLLHHSFFYAANKGSIVNFHMVKKVTEDSFLMRDGSLVPIARRRYKEAKAAYSRFHFEKLCEEAE